MSGPAAVAIHPRAGRIEPTRLAARFAEASGAPGQDEALPIAAEAPLAPGTARVGPLEIQVALNRTGEEASLDLRVRNGAEGALFVQSVVLGLRWTGHGAGSLRFLRHGWQSWSPTGARDLDPRGPRAPRPSAWLRGMHHAIGALPSDRSGWHESDLVTAVGRAPSGPCCLLGALERGHAFGVAYLRPEGEAVALEMELCLDAELQPGEERELERVRVALGEDAGGLLEEYADAYARLAGARVARPFVAGWCGWQHSIREGGEDELRRHIEALVALRGELPVDLVEIGDGYQRAVGDWLLTRESLPRGLAPLAAEIRDAGFTPGIWTAPFCAVAESELLQKHRDWMLRRGDGLLRGLLHPGWSADASVYVLDTTREEVRAHLEHTARALVQMGFAHLSLDFLYVAAMGARAGDAGPSRAERLRHGLAALRAGAGEEVFLRGSGCPLGAAVGWVDAMRVGPDVSTGWLPDDATAVPGLEPALSSTRGAVRNVLARTWMHRRLWINDPDRLRVDGRHAGLTPAERRTVAATLAAGGGVLRISGDPAALGAGDRELAGQALGLARELESSGLPGMARARDLLAGELAAGLRAPIPEGGIVALVNGSDAPVRARPDAAPRGGRLEPLLGSPPAGEELELEPHGSAVYRLLRPIGLAVFCDFDGTFSVQDVGATLAVRHAAERRPAQWARYQRGEISAWEYNMEILDGLPVPWETLEEFLAGVELDPGAVELVDWCRQRDVPFRVLSDGFDYNLNRLQQIHGVRFAYDANHLGYERGVWRIGAGSPDPSCGCGTGTCKRGRIGAFRRRHPGATAVHIGNGRVSDLCGALAADVAFAKGSLATELTERGESFEPFETLRDVVPVLERLLSQGAPGARRQRQSA